MDSEKSTAVATSEAKPDCAPLGLLGAVVMKHWTQGGTGVTNFDKAERAKYQAAIEANGDPEVVIVDEPIPGQGGYWSPRMKETMHSLHHVGRRKNLSAFWRTFRGEQAPNS